MKKHNVVILGAGTAGLFARSQVARVTDDYIVVDPGPLGTTCARVGCMPSKVFIEVANSFYRRHKFSEMGIHGASKLTIDRIQVMTHVRKLRDRFVNATLEGYEKWQDEKLIKKSAQFISKDTLDIEGERIQADNIIVTVGSRPNIPEAWVPFEDLLINTDSFFELNELPQKMAVIGLGPIGIELGQALSRLGIDVILIGNNRHIGGMAEKEIADYAADKLSQELSMDFSGVQSLARIDNQLLVKSKDQEYKVDKALLAIGRRSNLDLINFKATGLPLNEKGMPSIDPKTMHIANSRIFIAGDAAGDPKILHIASNEGKAAGINAVADEMRHIEEQTPLAITFCDPQLASVGQSIKQMDNYYSGRASFEGQGRSIIKSKEIGLMKIYGCKASHQILGADIFGPEAEHLAHTLAWAIQNKMTVTEALKCPFYHPTIEEALKTALKDLSRNYPKPKAPEDIANCEEHPTCSDC